MGLDNKTLAAAKSYVKRSLQGQGALQGNPGKDGTSPTVSVTNIAEGHKVTITDKNGTKSFDVMDGNADIAKGTIGIFTLSNDTNIQKDSILTVSKSQIIGHTPIKYPGQIYDIYAAIIQQGNEIYFTSFIIQKETGDWNQNYEIKLMGDPKKLTEGNGDAGEGADELLTIRDTVVTNISQLPTDSCCIHAIQSHIGFDFVDDIIGYQKYANTVEIFTMDGKIMTLNIGEDETLTYEGIDVWAKESLVDNKISETIANYYTKSEVDENIPTKTSQLTNDSGYISSVPTEYVTETELSAKDYATKTYVGDKITEANHLSRSIVTDLPTDEEASENVIYMLKVESAAGNDKYQEYMKIDGVVELVGDTSVDLTDYYNKNQVDNKISEAVANSGKNGTTFTPSVSEYGVISWTNDGGKENPQPVNIKGNKGDNGAEALVVNATFTSTPAINTSYLIDRSWLNRVPVPQEMVSGTVTDDKNVVYWVTGKVITASSNPYTVKFSKVNRLTGANGTNGITPSINSTNRHWMIGSTDTGVIAEGKDGRSIQSIAKDENENIIVTYSDGTTQNIGKLSVDISADFLTENGFGNIRYFNEKFQAYKNGEWADIAATPDNTIVVNMMPNPMQRIISIYDHNLGKNKLKWLEPEDTVVDGQIICVVDKVIIRRKLGSVPASETDGELVIEVSKSNFNSYNKDWYIDNGVIPTIDNVYYYKAFPVSTTGFVNAATVNEAKVTAKDHYLYGFVIDQNELDPDSMVTYIEDNKGFSKAFMDYSADRFNYGDWQDTFIMPKPCMLNTGGTVAYYLDLDDYTKKADGTDSDVANVNFDGNAMNEWGKIFWKVTDNGDGTGTFLFSDKKVDEDFVCWSNIDENGNEISHFYTSLYDGSLVDGKLRSLSGQTPMNNKTRQQELDYAHANNPDGVHMYETDVFCDIQLFRMLCVLISCSTNSKKAFGTGNNNSYVSVSNTGVKKSGTMNKNGMFWGDQTNKFGVKVFGREHPYGNIWKSCAGWINDKGTQKIKMTYGQSDGSTVDGYNIIGNGYLTVEDATPLGTKGGYISLCKFIGNGIVPKQANGSSTTKYCDGLWFNNEQVNYAAVSSSSSYGTRVGALASDLSAVASYVGWDFCADLSCKPPFIAQNI